MSGTRPGSSTSPRTVRTGSSSREASDPERRYHRDYGPHEVLLQPSDEQEQAALERAKRLEAADASASALSGEAGNVVARCPADPMHALEVVVAGPQGPIAQVLVELRSGADQQMQLRTNGRGEARFEGLAPGEVLKLRLLGAGTWTLEGSEALPQGRIESDVEAAWSAPTEDEASEHIVDEGECIWTLAERHGIDPDALWEANPELKAAERDRNVLAPGDRVILDPSEASSPVDVTAGTRVSLEMKPRTARVQLAFLDREGEPRAGLDLVVKATTRGGGSSLQSTKTDGDGAIDLEVPADTVALEVTLGTPKLPEVHHFRLAYLDPVQTISGAQSRLYNLGYDDLEDERGELGPLTRRALREFQRDHELTESGELDGPTRDELVKRHGS